MPALDVSQVLLDPMFQTRGLQCLRQIQTVDSEGIANNTPATFTFSGIVTNNSGDTLRREGDGSRIEGDITIHTRFKLIDGKNGIEADQVIYAGDTYVVSNVRD